MVKSSSGELNLIRIKRALVSVSDKSSLESLAKILHEHGVEIISTGGTLKYLQQHQLPVTPIEKITGNPEAFQGRMKTISFQIGSALLYRRDNEKDLLDLAKFQIPSIDLVVCNLYPFEQKVREEAAYAELIENIDIGGPTMIRAAAKNHAFVTVLSSVEQYQEFCQVYKKYDGQVDGKTRQKLALAAFSLTSHYDTQVSKALSLSLSLTLTGNAKTDFPVMNVGKGVPLRYGENPHQKATLYPFLEENESLRGVAQAQVLQGKELSYNNYLDADAAWKCASDVRIAGMKGQHGSNPCVVSIIKHMNPCGVAMGTDPLQVLESAWAGDPVSSFGGILCFTSALTLDCANWLKDKFIEVLVIPGAEEEALKILSLKKNLRVLVLPPRSERVNEKMIKSLSGGLLVQDEDEGLDQEWHSVSKLPFPKEKLHLAQFGIMVTKHLKSNAIALVQEQGEGQYKIFSLLSSGMGQPNRVDALKALSIPKGKARREDLGDAVLISDAFFPFPDTVHEAHRGGLRFLVQPGGSMRDSEVVGACDDLGMSMLLTGRRHFRH